MQPNSRQWTRRQLKFSFVTQQIAAGDHMLFGNNCVVTYYENVDNTGYSYSLLGKIENLASLAQALKTGATQITFNK